MKSRIFFTSIFISALFLTVIPSTTSNEDSNVQKMDVFLSLSNLVNNKAVNPNFYDLPLAVNQLYGDTKELLKKQTDLYNEKNDRCEVNKLRFQNDIEALQNKTDSLKNDQDDYEKKIIENELNTKTVQENITNLQSVYNKLEDESKLFEQTTIEGIKLIKDTLNDITQMTVTMSYLRTSYTLDKMVRTQSNDEFERYNRIADIFKENTSNYLQLATTLRRNDLFKYFKSGLTFLIKDKKELSDNYTDIDVRLRKFESDVRESLKLLENEDKKKFYETVLQNLKESLTALTSEISGLNKQKKEFEDLNQFTKNLYKENKNLLNRFNQLFLQFLNTCKVKLGNINKLKAT